MAGIVTNKEEIIELNEFGSSGKLMWCSNDYSVLFLRLQHMEISLLKSAK